MLPVGWQSHAADMKRASCPPKHGRTCFVMLLMLWPLLCSWVPRSMAYCYGRWVAWHSWASPARLRRISSWRWRGL